MSEMHDPRLDRFHAYAAAFETAYETDDWPILAPYFTADATSELNGTIVKGRDAVLASFRDAVAMFDRRFDSRLLRLVAEPEMREERVYIKAAARYDRAGLDPLELIGEEWFAFEGDRIARHVDHVLNGKEVMTYLAAHAADLRPIVIQTEEHAKSLSGSASR
jgi:hypothetical protein